jgi:hypothetical protein
LTWSSMWDTVGRWPESKISETITSDTLIFWWTIVLPPNAVRIKCYDFEGPMNSSGHFASWNLRLFL